MPKNSFLPTYESDYCVIRTPLLSINLLKDFFNSDERSTNKKLQELYSTPLLQEAIYLASIELFTQLKKYLANELQNDQIEKLENTLLKYLLRSSYRCTPFGIFATVSQCYYDNYTEVSLRDNDPIKRKIRLDSEVIHNIIDDIAKKENNRELLQYISNTSIYTLGNKFRYFEYNSGSTQRIYNLASISKNPFLNSLIEYGKEPKSFEEFQSFIINKGYDNKEANVYINTLISENVLVATIKDHVSGYSNEKHLLRHLPLPNESYNDITSIVKQVYHLLLSDYPSLDNIKSYNKVINQLQSLKILEKQNSFIQINSYRNLAEGKVNKKVVKEINDVLHILCHLSIPTTNPRIATFKKKFIERYEEEMVPLALALDPDVGLGSIFTKDNNEIEGEKPIITALKESIFLWKSKKLTKALTNNENIIIDFEELPIKKPDYNKLPDSCYAFVNLLNNQKNEEEILFHHASGASSAKLFGRFCHDSEELYRLTKEEIKKEEQIQADRIFAEIVHIPQPRYGNLISRPRLRDYEILYLGASSIDKSHRITIDDLFLRIINGEIILWSKKLKKSIVPKLTTALNHTLINLPVFQFLCEFSLQKPLYKLKWDWEGLSKEDFLPRVVYKNVILSPRIWNISLSKNSKESSSLLLENFLKEYKIPDFVILGSGENGMILNIHNSKCKAIILKNLETKGRVILKEAFLQDHNSIIKNGPITYMNEVVIPLHKTSLEKQNTQNIIQRKMSANFSQTKIQRNFSIGSEWLYAKIYTGESAATELLVNEISKLTSKLLKIKHIDKWFFIRYSDTSGSHLRIRFHLTKREIFPITLDMIVSSLNKQLSHNKIWKFSFDVYKRELERYSPCMEDVEEVFYIQSIFTVKVLNYSKELSLRTNIVIFALIGMLENLEIEIDRFLNTSLDSFKREFNISSNNSYKKLLENDHRSRRSIFKDIITKGLYKSIYMSNHTALHTPLKRYNLEFKKVFLRCLLEKPNTNNLLGDLIHMFVNRFFDSNQRRQELLIYYNLVKFYEMKKNIIY